MSIAGVSQTTYKARKDYICDSCGLRIPKGTLYVRQQYFMDNKSETYHLGGEFAGDKNGCEEAKQNEIPRT